jgi:hypothetical protein
MSRQPIRPILGETTDQRLGALIRRFGGKPYVAPAPGVVELPSDAWYRKKFGDGGGDALPLDED